MPATPLNGTSTLDALDVGLIHCLQLDGRVPFRRVAEVLGVSEQTVARRYRALLADGVVRIVGVRRPAAYGQLSWVARIQTRPDSTAAVASALAGRDDVSWIRVAADGTLSASLQVRSTAERDDLLLSRLPRHAQVLGLAVHSVLHRFTASGGADWTVRSPLVDDVSAQALLAPVEALPAQVAVEPEDEPLLDALARDGRVAVADLARMVGWTPGRTARRLAVLLAGNVVYIDCDVMVEALGFTTQLEMWLTVDPGRLAEVGEAVADMPEVVFAAAVTGTANLLAIGLFRSGEEVYRFVTGRIGAMTGVRAVETVPTLRWVKQAGSLFSGERLTGTAPRKTTRPATRGGDRPRPASG